jgi:hypothetical protein
LLIAGDYRLCQSKKAEIDNLAVANQSLKNLGGFAVLYQHHHPGCFNWQAVNEMLHHVLMTEMFSYTTIDVDAATSS